MATDLLLRFGMVNSMGPFWPQNCSKGTLVPKGVKIPGICKKMISHPNDHTYKGNFWHVYIIYIGAYDNLYKFNLKYNQRSKKGKKKGPKEVKKI